MFLASENFELGKHLGRKTVLREHTLNRVLYHEVRTTLLHLSDAQVLFATNIAAVEHVLLLLFLLTRQNDLVGVDNDNEIACIDVRRVGWLIPST